MPDDDPIICACLCGTVRFEISEPEKMTSCNCSACRRYAALWAYAPPAKARFLQGEGTTIPYLRGEESLAFHHCATCGNLTHWQSQIDERRSFNMRLAENPDAVAHVRIRRFDGADTWTFLD